jgi:hypothetical protein
MNIHSLKRPFQLLFKHCLLLPIFLLFFSNPKAKAQTTTFNAAEYADMLWLNFHAMRDTMINYNDFKLAAGSYHRILRTPEVGLYNRCEVFVRNDSSIVLSIRGTVGKLESWMENFYAATVPATGALQLSKDYRFEYKLAENPGAAVHVGWLIGTGFLIRECKPTIDSLLQSGYRKIIVCGHSQGGAISFLTTSWLHYYYKDKFTTLRMKTYSSAAPKPGNLYYAYDYDFITRDAEAFRIVNTADWVPETPVSIQTIKDYNPVNPISNAKTIIGKQKFFVRMYMNSVYNKLDNSSAKASKRFTKYFGKKLYKQISKSLPGYEEPALAATNNYMPAGKPIILQANKQYDSHFSFDGKNYFVHHGYEAYMYLLNEYYGKNGGN